MRNRNRKEAQRLRLESKPKRHRANDLLKSLMVKI